MKKMLNIILLAMVCCASNVLAQNDRHRSSHGSDTVVCKAKGSNTEYCQVPNLSGVQIIQEMSNRNQCRGNWGYSSNGIWVKGGCHARFSITRYNTSNNSHSSNYRSSGKPHHDSNNYASTGEKIKIKCKSRNNQRKICDTKGHFIDAKLTREISKGKYPCDRNWGVNKRGQLYVEKNCYGEFTVYK